MSGYRFLLDSMTPPLAMRMTLRLSCEAGETGRRPAVERAAAVEGGGA